MVTPGTWAYRLEQLDLDGTAHFSDGVYVNVVTSVLPEQALPSECALGQNFPNPFNPTTTILYAVPRHSNVKLTVYTMLGQQVAILVDGEMEAGYHQVQFDASGLASGVYYYRMQTGDFVQSKRLILLK